MKPTPPVTKMCGILPVFVLTPAPAHLGCTRALLQTFTRSLGGSHWALKNATLCRALRKWEAWLVLVHEKLIGC